MHAHSLTWLAGTLNRMEPSLTLLVTPVNMTSVRRVEANIYIYCVERRTFLGKKMCLFSFSTEATALDKSTSFIFLIILKNTCIYIYERCVFFLLNDN